MEPWKEGVGMGAAYEREFKSVLSGDARAIAGLGKTMSVRERVAYERTLRHPFLVVRAAGSLGADLVAVRHDLAFLAEVKSSKAPALYLSGVERLRLQSHEIRRQCERTGVLPVYAFRRKGVRGDAWRLFTMPAMELSARPRLVWSRLPKIATTSKGGAVLRFKDGMPLATFLDLVCRDLAEGTRPLVDVRTGRAAEGSAVP